MVNLTADVPPASPTPLGLLQIGQAAVRPVHPVPGARRSGQQRTELLHKLVGADGSRLPHLPKRRTVR